MKDKGIHATTKITLITSGLIIVFALIAYFSNINVSTGRGYLAKVYESSDCGDDYASILKKDGFKVEVIETISVGDIKDQYNIPDEVRSCHTTIIDRYFIEGHVPVKAIKKLLREKPDIDGIALKGFSDTKSDVQENKSSIIVIHQLTKGHSSEFMSLDPFHKW